MKDSLMRLIGMDLKEENINENFRRCILMKLSQMCQIYCYMKKVQLDQQLLFVHALLSNQ